MVPGRISDTIVTQSLRGYYDEGQQERIFNQLRQANFDDSEERIMAADINDVAYPMCKPKDPVSEDEDDDDDDMAPMARMQKRFQPPLAASTAAPAARPSKASSPAVLTPKVAVPQTFKRPRVQPSQQHLSQPPTMALAVPAGVPDSAEVSPAAERKRQPDELTMEKMEAVAQEIVDRSKQFLISVSETPDVDSVNEVLAFIINIA